MAGALERRAWTTTSLGQLYANLFVLLVGAPATGKSVSIDMAHEMWTDTGELSVAPSRITRAAFIEKLAERSRTLVLSPSEMVRYHALQVPSAEFGILVPQHDLEWLNTLNELFDARKVFDAHLKGDGKTIIEGPYVNLIAGTQPKYLSQLLPEAAFGMGFTSRLIMVYSAEKNQDYSVFDSPPRDHEMQKALLEDLKSITQIYGEFFWTDGAKEFFEEQNRENFPPVPDHSKLFHYRGRRYVNVLKLSMAFSLSESSDLIVHPRHVREAIDTLQSAERVMPGIFTEMAYTNYDEPINSVFFEVQKRWMKTNRSPVPESFITSCMTQRVPSNLVLFNIELMIRNSMLIEVIAPQKALQGKIRFFRPGSPEDMEISNQ